MMTAIRTGNTGRLINALDSGADPNIAFGGKRKYDAHTPLQFAGLCGNLDAARRLLAEGGNVNGERINDIFGTPLTSAASRGHISLIRLFAENKADINQKNYTRTALHEAVLNHQPLAVEALLELGADMHTTDRMGATPFQDALKDGLFDIAKSMIDRGQNLEAANDAGITMHELLDEPENKPVKDYIDQKAAAKQAALDAVLKAEADFAEGLAKVHELRQPVKPMRPVQFRVRA